MDNIYLIEIRLALTKWRIRKTISYIGRLFSIEGFLEHHPHVTLFGPFTLNEGVSSRQIIDILSKVAAGYDPIPFTIDGWEMRQGIHGNVIAFPVRPSDSLKKLTSSVAGMLSPLTHSHNIWDAHPDSKWFHVTVANRMDPLQAVTVFSALTGLQQEEPLPGILFRLRNLLRRVIRRRKGHAVSPITLDDAGLRITVMQGDDIFTEYDLLEKRWISGDHSHSSKSWQKTLALFRQQSGFERLDPLPSHPEDIFLIADLHLGHANIIHYCSRPFLFSDVREMDHVLIKNWNYTISPANRVYYLGDLRYGTDALPALQYRQKLKGNITFVTGNHDDEVPDTVPSCLLDYGGFRFLLIHDPADCPSVFDGWVIHGHHHNNDLRHYPFIDFEHRRINVSAEVIGYSPVNLKDICELIRERMSWGDMTPILLKYPYCSE
jgi:calcineurin-like phosphoesterase family protein